jgi:hypothetical protein
MSASWTIILQKAFLPWKQKTEEKKSKVLSKMKKIQKIYRSHRDALTFSGAFISHVMRECINVNG